MLIQSFLLLQRHGCLWYLPWKLCTSRATAEKREAFFLYAIHMVSRALSICSTLKASDRIVPGGGDSFWDDLISGYINAGNAQCSLDLYQRMHGYSLQLSAYTYVALVKACTNLRDVEMGCKLHAQVAENGLLASNPHVGTALIDMYAKCGMLVKAQELFDTLLMHDVVACNALISGYVQHAHGEDAIICFEKLQLRSVSPSSVTFTCILKACGAISAISKGRQVHCLVIYSGLLEANQFIGNALVDMYAKWGLLAMAKQVFFSLPGRNIVTWNTLIAGYVQHEHNEEALKSFENMRLEGLSPNGVTYACVLKACGCLRALEKGAELHRQAEERELLEADEVIGNALVDMYAKCGMLSKAQKVFDSLQNHTVVSWSALIARYVQVGCCQEALHCFELMQLQGVSPNDITYACILKACGSIRAIAKGQEIHADLDKKGHYKANRLVGNALIDMYAKFGLLAKGQRVFDRLPTHDIVSWNALLAGYVHHEHGKEALYWFEQMRLQGFSPNEVTYTCSLKACGLTGAIVKGRELHAEVDKQRLLESNIIVGNALVDMYAKCGMLTIAQLVFEKLPLRDIVSWNTLIGGHVQQGYAEEALHCFEQMKLQGVYANSVTFAWCLKACGSIGATEKGKKLHREVEQEGLLETNQLVGNAVVDMYAKCGALAKAREVFDILPRRDIVSWTALITGYAQLGEYVDVLDSFDRMRGEGIMPDPVTFLSVLSACSHMGLVDKGQMYFEAMSKEFNIAPTLEHHICMVDLLSRAGQLDKAMAFTRKVSPQPSIRMWLTLLGACRKWENVELGRQAFDQVLLLDKKEASAYLCMYNIYADAGMYDEAKQVEAKRVANKLSEVGIR